MVVRRRDLWLTWSVNVRNRIGRLDGVQKDDTRFAIGVRVFRNGPHQVPGIDRAPSLSRVPQLERFVGLARGHELVRNADGNVKVGNVSFHGLALDEILNVRMVDAHDAHVSASARAALHDAPKHVVVRLHERNRAGRNAIGRAKDAGALWTQLGEIKSIAAARLLNQHGITQRFHDAFHAVFNGQHEAGGQLAQWRARTCPRRRIGKKLHPGQHAHVFVANRLVGRRQNAAYAPHGLVHSLSRVRQPTFLKNTQPIVAAAMCVQNPGRVALLRRRRRRRRRRHCAVGKEVFTQKKNSSVTP